MKKRSPDSFPGDFIFPFDFGSSLRFSYFDVNSLQHLWTRESGPGGTSVYQSQCTTYSVNASSCFALWAPFESSCLKVAFDQRSLGTVALIVTEGPDFLQGLRFSWAYDGTLMTDGGFSMGSSTPWSEPSDSAALCLLRSDFGRAFIAGYVNDALAFEATLSNLGVRNASEF